MSYEYRAIIKNVVDGDTVDAIIDLGFKISTTQRLRLAHVYTPEKGHHGSKEAKEFTTGMALNREVQLKTDKISKFGYYLAEITLPDGQDLASAIIKAGLGIKYEGGKK